MRRTVLPLLIVALATVAACSGGTDKVATFPPPTDPVTTTTTAAPSTTTRVSQTSTTNPATTSTDVAAPATEAPPTTSAPLVPVLAPDGEAAYVPPDPLPPVNPGDVIWHGPLGEVAGARSELMLYRSTALDGTPIAVSGVMVVPDGPEPAGGRVVMSWAHGTTGSADLCAPSKVFGPHHIVELNAWLAAGYSVVATDYEGLGVPGPHPYLVGESQGRSVLDAARAARALLGSAASDQVLIGGHSQGGQAAIWAGHLAPTYAPELDVEGVVAIAPAMSLSGVSSAMAIRPIAGFGVASLAGLAAADPTLDLADVLSAETIADMGVLEERCISDVLGYYTTAPYALATAPAASLEDWGAAIAANDQGATSLAMPLLVTQGDRDSLIIESTTAD